MIDFARKGRGACRPFAKRHQAFKRDWLNDAQKAAVRHIVESRDRVILVRGAAGVGKTTLMQEAVEAIEAAGTKVFAFAPSADASRGTLRDAGFKDADTVARLLVDEKLQRQVAGQLIWIDEAGLLRHEDDGPTLRPGREDWMPACCSPATVASTARSNVGRRCGCSKKKPASCRRRSRKSSASPATTRRP